jgi:hypothetical protein
MISDFVKSEYFCCLLKTNFMIQRIQSLFLLMTSLLSLLFLKGSYLTFFDNSGIAITLTLTGLFKTFAASESGNSGIALIILILAVIIPLLSLATIFMFKRRNIQLLNTKILIALIVAFIAASIIYSINVISKFDASFGSWYKLAIPPLQLIFSVMAFKGIKKDDDLVKSYDRLR